MEICPLEGSDSQRERKLVALALGNPQKGGEEFQAHTEQCPVCRKDIEIFQKRFAQLKPE